MAFSGTFLDSKVEKHGRLPSNLVIIQKQKSNGQFRMTIPRALAQSLRLQPGDIMEGFIERGDLVFRIKS